MKWLLLLAAVLLGALIYLRESPPALSAEEHFRIAETLHASGDTAASLWHYQQAVPGDSPTAVRALFGAGQILILEGDTAAAIRHWVRAAGLQTDSFSTLRALKTIADAEYDSARLEQASLWYRRIVDLYGHDTEMTQQTKLIVEAARKRME